MILSAAVYSALAALQGGGLPWWVWVVIIVVILLVIVWAMQRQPADQSMPPASSMPAAPPKAVEPPKMAEPEAAAPMAEAPPAAEETLAAEPMAAEMAAPAAEMPAEAESQPEMAAPDDLTKIEGIGPAIATALQSGGISTYQQLADSKADDIREMMRAAGIRGGDPSTWAQQAKMAAAGDWAKLKKLQDRLIGGRRV